MSYNDRFLELLKEGFYATPSYDSSIIGVFTAIFGIFIIFTALGIELIRFIYKLNKYGYYETKRFRYTRVKK